MLKGPRTIDQNTMSGRSLTTNLKDSTSVLLVAPTSEPAADHACADLLTFDDPRRENILSVTFSQTPAERLALWRRESDGTMPNRAAVIDGCESSTAAERTAIAEEMPELSVDVLSDTAGPMEIALTIGQYLGEWAEDSERTLACIHSLSELLDSFDRGEVVQLINALDARLDAADAVAHYHLDPEAHDEQTVAEIRPLFDAVVEHVPEDGWTVTTASRDEAPRFRGESSALYPGATPTDQPPLDWPLDDVFELLSDDRRRTALYALAQSRAQTTSLEDLADEIVDREVARGDVTGPLHRREVKIALVHNHLPRLDEAGLVEYDHEASEVTKREFAPGLVTFLRNVDGLDRP